MKQDRPPRARRPPVRRVRTGVRIPPAPRDLTVHGPFPTAIVCFDKPQRPEAQTMDKPALIEKLNHAVSLELAAAIQYGHYASVLMGADRRIWHELFEDMSKG